MSETTIEEIKEEVEYQQISEFLESTPPNQRIHISDLVKVTGSSYGGYTYYVRTPEIQLHCDHDNCNGIRFFRCISGENHNIYTSEFSFFYVTYICSNCQKVEKIFSLAAKVNDSGKGQGECYKFGELPTYGPPVASKLMKLIGPDRDEFLKGRRCENQGLGVGSFIYYRRVVENQKNRILGEIIKVANKIGTSQSNIEILEKAIEETQFTKALDMAKNAIPESLLINGHSPIKLLHSALSEGVHALSDEECLEMASSVRIVLGELSERLAQALKDEAELTKALSRLMKKS
ncbi:hypothetical protein [Aliarcobacter cryaerophilus]|uniref:hypothetical protein n=1 Tax=Aliarcobacter cryaerophilus TaxID=28198 RepID=UPI000EB04808|nr:hypothetical protein [Aliarcobacter cryaerophilus]